MDAHAFVGARFSPTDVELICHYLQNKINGEADTAIKEVNIYDFEPKDLPRESFLPSTNWLWYYFCKRDADAARQARQAKGGFWKQTGKKVIIKDERGQYSRVPGTEIGYKSVLTFTPEEKVDDRKSESTQSVVVQQNQSAGSTQRKTPKPKSLWVIHEYSLGNETQSYPYVLCRLEYKGIENIFGNPTDPTNILMEIAPVNGNPTPGVIDHQVQANFEVNNNNLEGITDAGMDTNIFVDHILQEETEKIQGDPINGYVGFYGDMLLEEPVFPNHPHKFEIGGSSNLQLPQVDDSTGHLQWPGDWNQDKGKENIFDLQVEPNYEGNNTNLEGITDAWMNANISFDDHMLLEETEQIQGDSINENIGFYGDMLLEEPVFPSDPHMFDTSEIEGSSNMELTQVDDSTGGLQKPGNYNQEEPVVEGFQEEEWFTNIINGMQQEEDDEFINNLLANQ